jgi:MOSC domain-containing protein YiiM
MNNARLVQINISSGGVPKRPIPKGEVTFARVRGDDWNDKKHHGHRDQAICLFSVENIAVLKSQGFPLFPGALGENFTTEGLNHHSIRVGQMFRVGKVVVIRISRVRTPCRTITVYGEGLLKAMYDAEVRRGNSDTPLWGRSGFYAEVIREGTVLPGDLITPWSPSHPDAGDPS